MDIVTFDEVQEMKISDMEKVGERMSASAFKCTLMGSTANWPDADIDYWYKKGSRHRFHTACPTCGRTLALEDLVWEPADGRTGRAPAGTPAGALRPTRRSFRCPACLDRRGLIAIAIAACMAMLLLEHPTVSVTVFLFVALGMATLSPRAPGDYDAWRWTQRLVVGAVRGLLRPFADLRRLYVQRLGRRSSRPNWTKLSTLILPVVGGMAFLALFTDRRRRLTLPLAELRYTVVLTDPPFCSARV